MANDVINGLWIGSELSSIELLTLKSFVKNGHTFKLWVYDHLKTEIPEGVVLCDASTIIPGEKVFSYKNKNKWGHGKGSFAGFSDVFRYKLLYENGGWWVDMDVTCLKLFNVKEEYFFRSHNHLSFVGNVMKCPKGSELMKRCYEEAIESVDADNTDWHKPLYILNKHIRDLDLSSFGREGFCNPDSWFRVKAMLYLSGSLPKNFYCLHWLNEEWRTRAIDKTDFHPGSVMAKLMDDYQLISFQQKSLSLLQNLGYLLKYLLK